MTKDNQEERRKGRYEAPARTEVRKSESGRGNVASNVSERVDADDTIVAFTPRIPPHMQPFTNASSESSAGRTASRVLSSGMFFLTNDGIGCGKRKC